jgi:hypothetical protein
VKHAKHRVRSRAAGGHGMPTRLSDGLPKKTSIAIVSDVQDPFSVFLKLTNKRLGFLINFNVPVIKRGIKRIIL